MTTPTREQVAAALFARLQTAGSSFKTYGDRVKLWKDVPQESRPALFLMETDEEDRALSKNMPIVVTQSFNVLVYTNANANTAVAPRTLLNAAIEAVEATLAPDPNTDRQTLGGIVFNARIEGTIFKDPGDLDGDGLAVIPILVLVPG